MSELSGPRLRSLLRQADKAAEYGKLQAAVELYQQILEEGGEVPEALLGLAGVSLNESERKQLYTRVLTIQPDNEIAQYELAVLRGESPAPPPPSLLKEVESTEVVEKTAEPTSDESRSSGEEVLYCYRHPSRETALRCYSCNRPICIDCTNKTPVGYICPDCKRSAEDKFYEATSRDYILAASFLGISNIILGAILVIFILYTGGFGFLGIFIGFFVGGAIGRFLGSLTLRVTERRRGRYIPMMGSGFMILGVLLPAFFVSLLLGVLPLSIMQGAYLFGGVSAIAYQLR